MVATYLTLDEIWEKIEPYAVREGLSTIKEYYDAGKSDELYEANLRDYWLFYRSELEVLLDSE